VAAPVSLDDFDAKKMCFTLRLSKQPRVDLDSTLLALESEGRSKDILALANAMMNTSWRFIPSSGARVILKACAMEQDIATADRLMKDRLGEVGWHLHAQRYVRVYGDSRNMEGMLHVLTQLRQHGVADLIPPFRTALYHLITKGHYEQAKALWQSGPRMGIRPEADPEALNLMMTGCARMRDGGMALWLLQRAEHRGLRVSDEVLSKAVRACKTQRHEAAAREVAKRVTARQVEGGEIRALTESIMVVGGMQGLKLMYEAASCGMYPTMASYNALGMPRRALEIFQHMAPGERDTNAYREAIRAFSALPIKGQELASETLWVVQEMRRHGVEMDREGLKMALTALEIGEAGTALEQRVEQLLDQVRHMSVYHNSTAVKLTLPWLLRLGHREEAVRLVEDVFLNTDLPPIEEHYTDAIMAAGAVGLWPVACYVFDQARALRLVTNAHLRTVLDALDEQGLADLLGIMYYEEVRGVPGNGPWVRHREGVLDFHRFSVVEARLAVIHAIATWKQQWEAKGSPSQVPNLSILAGSPGGKLWIAVVELLYSRGYIREKNYTEYQRRTAKAKHQTIVILGSRLRYVWGSRNL
jgi:hypothetical protein